MAIDFLQALGGLLRVCRPDFLSGLVQFHWVKLCRLYLQFGILFQGRIQFSGILIFLLLQLL